MRSNLAVFGVVFLLLLACSLTPGSQPQAPEDGRVIPRSTANTLESPTSGLPAKRDDWWKPEPGTTWQWQLDQPIDLSFDVMVIDVDLFETDPDTLGILKSRG